LAGLPAEQVSIAIHNAYARFGHSPVRDFIQLATPEGRGSYFVTQSTDDRVHAQQRCVQLGDGKRPRPAFDDCRYRRARPVAGLGSDLGPTRPRQPPIADVPAACVESPLPAPPRWEDCPDVDLGFHLQRVAAPRPGTFDTVLEMARLAEMADFDRTRPLWEITLIDGLEDGGAALLCKLHHSLTDGIGGVQIAMTLVDSAETPRNLEPMPAEPKPRTPRPWDALSDVARFDADLVATALAWSLTVGPGLILNGVRR
jgi:Wax ester synthase/diacylglycerol acyltransferase catalytic domain